MSRILYLTVSAGAGHIRAAEAVKQGMQLMRIRSRSVTVDAFRYANRLLSKVVIGTYMEILKMSPFIYGYLYSKAEASDSMGEFNGILNRVSSMRFRRLLGRFHPDVVICTHAYPAGVMARLKHKGYLKAPLVTIVTDYTVHPFWSHKDVDLYFISCNDQKERMVARGIDPSKIYITGMPIDPKFMKVNDRGAILRRYGLRPDLPTILVMGGGLGLGPVKNVAETLGMLSQPHQLMVVAGKNCKLRDELHELGLTYNIPIKIFGYVDNVNELMDAADLIVTKPGGLTSAEAMAKGLPMVIVNPLPGQEERNAAFLVQRGAALIVDDIDLLAAEVGKLLAAPQKLAELRQNALALGNPRAAVDIVRIIKEKCGLKTRGKK